MMLLSLSIRVVGGDPLVVAGGELGVVGEASLELGEADGVGVEVLGGGCEGDVGGGSGGS